MSAACPSFGFNVRIRMRANAEQHEEAQLWQSFMRDVIAVRGLTCGGTRTHDHWSQIIRSEASQATDTDREAVKAWLASRREVDSVEIGPLVDLGNAG
jgi:uncharacterized protein YggL (DUF469 family)